MSTQKIIVQKKQKIKKGNYILGETIGEGAFAKVKLATHIFTGEKVAIKILDKQVLEADAQNQNIQNDSSFLNDMQRIKKEIKILKELRHKNIIQLYEIMESENKLYIVMEYCEGKELFDYIVKRKHLTEKEACRFFQQIINGVEYLHLNNITHRDLKPENLLLTNKKRIKISDFGLSTKTNNYYDFLTTPCGTPSYAPPEMLRGDEYSGIYSDIWSCGIILYTMLVGNLPCAESKEYLIYECIIKHNYEYPSYLSEAVKDLLEKILKVNPQERIGFEQIKKHPWFNIINPRLRPGIIMGVHKIPIDDNILNVVKNYDYKIEDVKYSVENSLYDDKTTIYYLILKQFIKEGKNSNSDLFSSDYLNFIKNLDNWIKPEKVNDDKFKEYRKWVDLKQTNKLFKPKKIDNNSVNLSTNNNKNNNSINNIKSSNVRRTLNSMSFSNNNNNNINIKLDRKNRMENYSQRTRILNDQHRRLYKSEGVIHKPNTARNSISNNNKINTNLLKSRNNIMKLNKEINKEHNRTFVLSSKPDRQSLNNNMNKTFYSFKKPFYNKLKKTKQKSLFVSFNEPIDSKTKESLLEDIEKNEKNFNDFYKKLENTTNNPNQNIVKLLAERLISSTIFSKYLLNQKTIISSPKKTIINHDIEKNIFSIQKYKDLLEDVKIKHIGLFRKKLYTFNSYTFSQYLNEEDDLILNENFIKQYHLSDFVNNLKFSIKRDEKQNLHQRLFSPSSNLNQSLNLNNSLLSSSRNSLEFSSRRILSPNSSMLSNTTFNRKNYSKLNSLKSNISKMEGISEDEDSFEEEKNNNEKTTLRKNTTGSGSLKNKGKVGFNNNIRTINKISAFTPDDNNSKNQKKTSKSMKKNSRNDKNLMLNDSSIQNLNKTSGSTSLFSLSSKDKFSIKDEIERNEPINLSCIFDLQIIDIINKIKEYSKNNSAYCNVKGNQLRLNKANISIIIIIDKVLINDGFFLYLKIRSKSKNNEKQSLKLINDLLIYLQ